MPTSFDLPDLTEINPTSLFWARNTARVIAKDLPAELDPNNAWPNYSKTDEEWNLLLGFTRVSVEAERYYLPWEAVALAIETDPTYAQKISTSGFSQEIREAKDIAKSIRELWRNQLIKYYPTNVQTLVVVNEQLQLNTGF